MKKLSIAVIGGAAMTFASLAQAADLPYRNAAPAGNYDYPATFTWTGFYAGLLVGGGIGSFTGNGATYFGGSPGGWLAGLGAGYNYQSGNLVVGGEADWAWTGIRSNANPWIGISSSGQVQDMMTIRARAGYAMDRLLIFGTAGYAGGSIEGTLNNFNQRTYANQSYWSNGVALGVGAEYALTPHITAKAEYLFTALSQNNYFVGTLNGSSVGANLNLLRAGVNYKF
jgi:outer membrane immunogenic protein